MTALRPEDIAHVCYEANRALQDVLGDSHVPPPWQVMTPAERAPYISAVAFALSRPPLWRRFLAALAGASRPAMRTPAEMHQAWMAAKAGAGWRHGPVADEARKEHPCLVPWRDLPPGQQLKDELFLAIVAAMSHA